jgi:Ca-activated chloride channel family protein
MTTLFSEIKRLQGSRLGAKWHLKLSDGGPFFMGAVASERFRSALVVAVFLLAFTRGAPAQANPSTSSSTPAEGSAPHAQTLPGSGDAVPPDATTQEPAGQDPAGNDPGMFVFKKQVQEVVLHATVVDERRHLVPYLGRGAFSVFENGASQTITSFRREDVPVAMGIVIDNSGSMRDKRDKVNQAVLNLIRASNPQDEIFVVNFSQNYYLDQDFTSDPGLLERALRQVSMQGSTALYDAIVASAVHLKNNPRLDKKVLLVVTDGQDNMSQETLEEAARRLQQSNGPTVYGIGLMGGDLRDPGHEALQRLADGSGGVAFFPQSLDEVDSITRTVAHDIRSQYTLAYKPHNQNAKPEFQSVRVEARAPGYGRLTVRTRSGYYGAETAR